MQTMEKTLGTALVMQLGVDPHKIGSIVGCRIVYVIFHMIVIS